jgi:phenylalanyl-tRNA synthetase beta chain
MNISYNWLKEFINLELSAEETAEKLTLIGLEVEEITTYGNLLEGVIVGKILDVCEHPNADRLRICRVDLGEGDGHGKKVGEARGDKNVKAKEREKEGNQTVQIICGADNVAVGQKVPVATVGTTLPSPPSGDEPFTIKKAALRGEPSNGMICAEDELGLSSGHKSDGIMVLDDNLTTGMPLHEVLELYRDTILDIAITPNRPDATCHLGVARDLAAALDLDLKKPFKTKLQDSEPLTDFDIEIENPEKCPRYAAKVIEGVTIGESPAWLKNRLKALNVRPVNNVVDVTNYVMLEVGQPLHAFDKNTLKGNKIVVKDFENDIKFKTLDHVKRDCPAGTLFICDGEAPVAIAGIMGGVDSEVSDATTDILLESAYFDPGTIRKTAKEQTLQTDASYRFERGIDPQLQRIAAERAAQLMADTAGGTVRSECSDNHPIKFEPKELTLTKSYTNRLLGTDFSINEIAGLLKGLELSKAAQDEDSITYTIPSFRPDLQREVDLIEEVGRLYDYNNIPKPRQGISTSAEPITDWEQLNSKIKELAKELRFREIYSNSLISDTQAARFGDTGTMLHTLNPISADMTTLRPVLLHGFLDSAAYNFNRNAWGVRFFESGHIFKQSKSGHYYQGIGEESRILFGLAGLKTIENWNSDPESYTIFDLKAVINSFLISLDLQQHISIEVDDKNRLRYFVGETEIGSVIEVQPDLKKEYEIEAVVFAAEFSISAIYELKQELPGARYEAVPKFPAFEYDFGVIVDAHVQADALLKKITRTSGKTLEDIRVFDVFEGESLGKNKKNIAFRLSFLDKNKTLTIKDVEPIIKKVLKVLDNKFSAKLRA